MKISYSFTIILFISALSLNAQQEENKEFNYLLAPGEYSFSGFGGFLLQFGNAEGSMAVYPGGGGALLINQKFFVGGYGLGLANTSFHNNVEVEGVRYDRLRTNFGHGGFWLGYINHSEKLIHFGVSAKIGWGELALYDDRFDIDNLDYLAKDAVFVMTPQIEAEMNITQWFKINLGVGYQWVSGVNDHTYTHTDVQIFEDKDFSTPQLSLGLLFGGFSHR